MSQLKFFFTLLQLVDIHICELAWLRSGCPAGIAGVKLQYFLICQKQARP
jgi:hypothetical protein